MTTDDVLCSRVQLNELLDISGGDTFTSFWNAILDDIRILFFQYGYSVPSNMGQATETLIIPVVDIAETPGG